MRDLERIKSVLEDVQDLIDNLGSKKIAVYQSSKGTPVTDADHMINDFLQKNLPEGNEGWLSEETFDDLIRLEKSKVWIVDPIDGTRGLIYGMPEWVVSIGLFDNGSLIAAGILNPSTRSLFLGSKDVAPTLNGQPIFLSKCTNLSEATVAISRSDLWQGYGHLLENAPFRLVAIGSIAYKLALVAAGYVDATISLSPKNEWDIAAGVHLIEILGGSVKDLDRCELNFNSHNTLQNGVIAGTDGIVDQIFSYMEKMG